MVTAALLHGTAPSNGLFFFVVFSYWDKWKSSIPVQLYADMVQQLIDLYSAMEAKLLSTASSTNESPYDNVTPSLVEVLETVLTLTNDNQKVDISMRFKTLQALCCNGYWMEAKELGQRLLDRKLFIGRCAHNVMLDHLDTSNPECLKLALGIIITMRMERKRLLSLKWSNGIGVKYHLMEYIKRVDFQYLFDNTGPTASTHWKYLTVIESVVRRGSFDYKTQAAFALCDLLNRFETNSFKIINCLPLICRLSILMKDDVTLPRVIHTLRSMGTLTRR